MYCFLSVTLSPNESVGFPVFCQGQTDDLYVVFYLRYLQQGLAVFTDIFHKSLMEDFSQVLNTCRTSHFGLSSIGKKKKNAASDIGLFY